MTGRALAIVAGLAADLQPAGWRLTDASGVDHRRARSLLAQDLDAVEELAQGYAGDVQDPGRRAVDARRDGREAARRQGAQRPRRPARARAGAGRGRRGPPRRPAPAHRRRRPLDRAGRRARPRRRASNAQVPTASGFGRHRRVDPPEASAHLEWVVAAIDRRRGRGVGALVRPADAVVAGRRHRGARPVGRPRHARRRPTSTPSPRRSRPARTVALGVVPSTDPPPRPSDAAAHRARAALARHAGPRPGDGGGAPRGHPDLRAGRRHAGVGRAGRTPVGDGRAQPLTGQSNLVTATGAVARGGRSGVRAEVRAPVPVTITVVGASAKL